jgi:hypothetical protein
MSKRQDIMRLITATFPMGVNLRQAGVVAACREHGFKDADIYNAMAGMDHVKPERGRIIFDPSNERRPVDPLAMAEEMLRTSSAVPWRTLIHSARERGIANAFLLAAMERVNPIIVLDDW